VLPEIPDEINGKKTGRLLKFQNEVNELEIFASDLPGNG
jgi:hypothetical protein